MIKRCIEDPQIIFLMIALIGVSNKKCTQQITVAQVRKRNLSFLFKILSIFILDFYRYNISFGTGQRGSIHLIINGYSYVKNRLKKGVIFWKCSRKVMQKNAFFSSMNKKKVIEKQISLQGSTKCRAKVVTKISGNTILQLNEGHNHPKQMVRRPRVAPLFQ